MLGDACKQRGTNIKYDEANKTFTVDLTGVDLEKNEGAKLMNDLVTSKHEYTFAVGSQYETAGGTVKFQTSVANLPPFADQRQGPTLSPPKGADDLIVVNPNAKRSMDPDCKCPDKEIAPLWGMAFHELAEAYAKIDHGKNTYKDGHGEAKDREERLRQQRPGLTRYLSFSGEHQMVEIRR